MPGFDGTGPNGAGRSGRGLGLCGRFGYGYRQGRGGGFGGGFRNGNRWFRNDCYIPAYPDDNRFLQQYNEESLNSRKKELEKELKWVDEELKEINQENK